MDLVRDSGTSSCPSRMFDDVEYVFIVTCFFSPASSAHLVHCCIFFQFKRYRLWGLAISSTQRYMFVWDACNARHKPRMPSARMWRIHCACDRGDARSFLWVHSSSLCTYALLQRRSQSRYRVSCMLRDWSLLHAWSGSNSHHSLIPATRILQCALTSK